MTNSFSPPGGIQGANGPSAAGVSPLLRVQGLRFGYSPQHPLLQDISFEVHPGEMVAIFGLNGSGKSTLLKCLTGFLRVQSGDIFWQGNSLQSLNPKQLATIAALVDSDDWEIVPFTVSELILMGLTPHRSFWGGFSEEDREKANRVISRLALSSLADRPFAELSMGERQRTKLAMAIVREPDLILLDEPTSHLDPFYQLSILRFLQGAAGGGKSAVVAVLHDVNLCRFFDRVLFLRNGMLAVNGNPRQLLTQSKLDELYGPGVFHLLSAPDFPVGILNSSPPSPPVPGKAFPK
jgi:iron complex transport system ATP-binding protein